MARANEYVVEVMPETSFGSSPNPWSGLVLPVASIDRAPAEPPAIEDPTIQPEDAAHPQIVGLVAGQAQAISCKAYSFGTQPSAGSAAAHVAETRLLESVFGAAATSTKRSTVKTATTPTPTEVIETDDDAHLATKIQIVGIELPGGVYESAAATYDAATDKLTLLTALSDTPEVGADVLAAHVYNYERDPATPPSLSIRAHGHDALQSFGNQGFGCALEIPELAPSTVPMFSFKGPIAGATRNPSGWTRPYATPRPGRCAAGLQLRIGKYGATAMQQVQPLRVAIGVRPGYRMLDDVTASLGAAVLESVKGIAGYIEITVKHDSNPNAILGSSYDDWRSFWEAQPVSGELFHPILTLSPYPGRAFAVYLPKSRVVRPENVVVDGRSAIKFRFVPATLETSDSAAVKASGEIVGGSW